MMDTNKESNNTYTSNINIINNINIPKNIDIQNTSKKQKTKKFLKIATINARGLNENMKQQQTINYMTLYNIDILGLSETSINNNKSRYICQSNEYTSYFCNEENKFKGSGVGLIFSN